ncbi:MAG TPA: hypothetical protein VF789_30790 [Thermoanaerobaculia bacterium]
MTDPWQILQTTPGVLVDRINVDGDRGCGCSAKQPFVEAGAAVGQGFPGVDEAIFSGNLMERFLSPGNVFTLAEETQGSAAGSGAWARPDEFLRRNGTNEWRASAFTLGGDGSEAASSVEDVRGFGAEVGGPLRKDRAWIWGGLGLHDFERTVLGGQRESQSVTGGRLKLNAQVVESFAIALAASRGGSEGDNAGAAPDRAPETTWDEDGGETIWAATGTVIHNSNFYTSASVGSEDRRREDDPQATGPARIGADGVARGGWFAWEDERRQRHARLSTALFGYTGTLGHEVTLGAGWLRRDEERALAPPGPLTIAGSVAGLSRPFALAELWRAGEAGARTETLGLWAQDVLTYGPWTGHFGVQADRQDLGLSGGPRPWTLAPRLQLHRFLDHAHKQVWVSLSRSASSLGPRAAWHVDVDAAVAAPFVFEDLDGDLALDPGETARALPGRGFDPLRPGVDPDAVDARLRPEITDEAVLGAEAELTDNFQVGLRAVWRRTRDLLEERLLVRDLSTGEVFAAAAGDWIPAARLTGNLPDGTPYDVPVWDLRPGLLWTGGSLLTNGDRRRDDLGLELTWKKLFSNEWNLDGKILWRDSDYDLGPDFRRFDDPTNLLGGGDDEGEPVEETASGRPYETPRFAAARWSFETNGMVRLGQGRYVLLASVKGRQGQPLPYFRQIARERAGVAGVQVTDRPDSFRAEDLFTVDAGLERHVWVGDASFSLAVQALNLLDERTVLERELDLGTGRAGLADEALSSRTLRVEVRFWWN